MPKLYFGERGGMYYKKGGRKVYVKSSSKKQSKFGKLKGVCKGADEIPVMEEGPLYGGTLNKWFNTNHLTDFLQRNDCIQIEEKKSVYANPIKCINDYVSLAHKDWDKTSENTYEKLSRDLDLNLKILNMLNIQLDPNNLESDYKALQLQSVTRKKKFRRFFKKMKNYMINEVIDNYAKFFNNNFNFLKATEQIFINNYNNPSILKEIPIVLFMFVMFKGIGYQECYLFPTLIFRIMTRTKFANTESVQTLFKNEYKALHEEVYNLDTPLIEGGNVENRWMKDQNMSRGYYYCHFLRDLLETLDDIEIMNEPYLEDLGTYAQKYYPAGKTQEEYIGEFRGCIHNVIKECERLLGMNGRPEKWKNIPSVIYIRGREFDFLRKFLTKEMIAGLLSSKISLQNCGLLPTYIENVMKKYYGFDFNKMEKKEKIRYYIYFKDLLESIINDGDEHSTAQLEGILRKQYKIENLTSIKMKKYIDCIDEMLTTINMLLRESLIEKNMDISVLEPEKNVIQNVETRVKTMIENLYGHYFDECVKIFNYYKDELRYLVGNPKKEKYKEIKHKTFQCIAAQIEVFMNTIIEEINPTRERHTNTYKQWSNDYPMPAYKREIIPRASREDMINLARQILSYIIDNKQIVGDFVRLNRDNKEVSSKDEKYFLLDFWRECIKALQSWADKQTVTEFKKERVKIQQELEAQEQTLEDRVQTSDIVQEIIEEKEDDDEEYETDDEEYETDDEDTKGLPPKNNENPEKEIPSPNKKRLSQLKEEESAAILAELREAMNSFGSDNPTIDTYVNLLVTELKKAKNPKQIEKKIKGWWGTLQKSVEDIKKEKGNIMKKVKGQLENHKHWEDIKQILMNTLGIRPKTQKFPKRVSKRVSSSISSSFNALKGKIQLATPLTFKERVQKAIEPQMSSGVFTQEERNRVIEYMIEKKNIIENNWVANKNVFTLDGYISQYFITNKASIGSELGIDLNKTVDMTVRTGVVEERKKVGGTLADNLQIIVDNLDKEFNKPEDIMMRSFALAFKMRAPEEVIKGNMQKKESSEKDIEEYVKKRLENGSFAIKNSESEISMTPEEFQKLLEQYEGGQLTSENIQKIVQGIVLEQPSEQHFAFGSIEERFYNGMSFGCYPFH